MRIAIVEPDEARRNTSIEAQARMWEFISRNYGCKVTIFADRGLNYHDERLEVKNLRRLGGRFWCPPYPALLARLRGYDVIVTADPSLYPYALSWAPLAAKVSRSRLVLNTSVTLLTPSPATWRGRLILRLARVIYDQAHKVIVPTPFTTERQVKLGLLTQSSDKVVELGHPVDTELFCPGNTRPADSEINILSVGKLIPEKGYHIVIEALADLLRNQDKVHFLIAGEGPHRQTLEEMCRKYGVAHKVSFLGLIPNEQLAEIYRKCHIFVHHPLSTERWEEFFGVAVVEAMSSGLPVVVSDRGAMKYTAPPGARFIVPYGDREAIKQAVNLLIDNPHLRAEMGACGRKRVVERYSVPEVARRCYQMVLS